MNKSMRCYDRENFEFADYKSPIMHRFHIKLINQVVYRAIENLLRRMPDEAQPIIENLFDKLDTDPLNLTEEEAATVQILRMCKFYSYLDLTGDIDQNTKNFIMANRIKYQAAWGTQDAETIKEAIEECQLFAPENAYEPLSKKVIMLNRN